jgi:hypothetical protein
MDLTYLTKTEGYKARLANWTKLIGYLEEKTLELMEKSYPYLFRS